jgi:8-oxo-dGTP pyrophosphatase MutT (NUDIX family)
MHRRLLLDMLDTYVAKFPAEADVAARIRQLVGEHTDCFERTCRPGHITAAAWILSADRRQCLLTHHRQLDKWLQLGGHADGQWDAVDVAVRESQEESGIRHFLVARIDGCLIPIDIDVHEIPARYDPTGELLEDTHEHHDIRFLLVAAAEEEVVVSDESHGVRWLTPDEVAARTGEESVLRMLRKAMAWMA